MKHLPVALLALTLAAGLEACVIWPSVGYQIPGTPVSLGVGFPLPLGNPSGTVFRPLGVESVPNGVEVYVNNSLVGSTPMTISVPFPRGYWGEATGQAQLLFKKAGYLPYGVTVFASHGGISRTPDGVPMRTFRVEMAHE